LKYFLSFRVFEQLALALKTRVHPEMFHCIEIFFIIQIFEQLALALRNRVCPELTVLNIYFLSFSIFEQLALALKARVYPEIFQDGGRPPFPTPRLVRLRLLVSLSNLGQYL